MPVAYTPPGCVHTDVDSSVRSQPSKIIKKRKITRVLKFKKKKKHVFYTVVDDESVALTETKKTDHVCVNTSPLSEAGLRPIAYWHKKVSEDYCSW